MLISAVNCAMALEMALRRARRAFRAAEERVDKALSREGGEGESFPPGIPNWERVVRLVRGS